MDIFYEPADGRCGDFIPFYHDGLFHLFHIKGHPWHHVSTADLVNVREHGLAIPGGGHHSQDRDIYTGCVVEKDGTFHIFYTGHNPDMPQRGGFSQVLMHAVSPDLMNWTKDPDWHLPPAPEHYGPGAWRDPHVFYNEEEGRYWMLLTAHTKEGPADRLGCVGLLTSENLLDWRAREPLWAPALCDGHECPDMFRIGEWWYLLFSQYRGWRPGRSRWQYTRYRMARSPRGPWIAPAQDTFDERAFYAAKTATDGRRRVLFGWTGVKEGAEDAGGYCWGGCLMAHELRQRPDGTLAVRPPRERTAVFSEPTELRPRPELGEWTVGADAMTACCGQRFGSLRLGPMPEPSLVTARVEWAAGTESCGLILRADERFEDYYMVILQPGRGRLRLDRWLRPRGYRSLERAVRLEGGAAELKVFTSGTVIAVYVNDEIALSGRLYDLEGGEAGVFASEGNATFGEVSVRGVRR